MYMIEIKNANCVAFKYLHSYIKDSDPGWSGPGCPSLLPLPGLTPVTVPTRRIVPNPDFRARKRYLKSYFIFAHVADQG